MTDWWKVSFSSLHANASMGMLPGKCKNQSTWVLTFLRFLKNGLFHICYNWVPAWVFPVSPSIENRMCLHRKIRFQKWFVLPAVGVQFLSFISNASLYAHICSRPSPPWFSSHAFPPFCNVAPAPASGRAVQEDAKWKWERLASGPPGWGPLNCR